MSDPPEASWECRSPAETRRGCAVYTVLAVVGCPLGGGSGRRDEAWYRGEVVLLLTAV